MTTDSTRADFVFHGHFYQPPRENPWTDQVDREPSAYPFHDWNQRITHECYAANAAAKVHDERGKVREVVDNYDLVSFNFGPTLLRWLERHDALTLRRIVEADRRSVKRFGGHGNAIAQAYNHMILALADERDRRTQVRWGIDEFEHRFGREPESLWLAETAANHEVLDVMIEEGLRYVILAPQQAGRVRAAGEGWSDVRGGRVDPTQPYFYRHRRDPKRTLAVFFYDGPLAQSVSFGEALRDGKVLADRAEAAIGPERGRRRLVHCAVDGETAGHHVAWGNLALTWALRQELPKRGFRITNYGQFLEENPPIVEVELDLGPYGEGSSWSCAHGVGRWIRDCSCRIDPGANTQQRWRGPLRAALDLLRDGGRRFFEQGATMLRDPWAARDAYVQLLLERVSAADFLEEHGREGRSEVEEQRALALLEMQHQLMLMYTSCGWFFDDIGGLESVQILRYAARAMELWEELGGAPPREAFLRELAKARSNDAKRGTGADIFRRDVLAVRVTPERAVAHLAMTALHTLPPEFGRVGLHRFARHAFHLRESDGMRLAIGHFELEHLRTRHRHHRQVVMLHRGGLEFTTAVTEYDPERYEPMQNELLEAFDQEGAEGVEARLDAYFGPQRYRANDLLESGRQELLERVFEDVISRFTEAYAELYEENRDLLADLHEMGMELPEELRVATGFTLRQRFEREFEEHADDEDAGAHERALEVAREALRHDVRLDSPSARRWFEASLEDRLRELARAHPPRPAAAANHAVERIEELLTTADALHLKLDLARSQLLLHESYHERPEGQRPSLDGARLDALAQRLGFAPGLFP